MKACLNVGERMTVLAIMPKEGSFVTLRLIRGLVEKLGLSAQELQEYEVTEDTEQHIVRWNVAGSIPKEIEFADAETDIIKRELKRLDTGEKLTQSMIPIYEKFMGVL